VFPTFCENELVQKTNYHSSCVGNAALPTQIYPDVYQDKFRIGNYTSFSIDFLFYLWNLWL